MSDSEKVVVRMAPSPTGNFHVGGVRTALYNFLFAKKNNGKFILRIEDTDKERSKKEFEDDILESLAWLGLKYDEFYRQSERGEVYKNYIEKMLGNDSVYEAEDKVIRFRNPNKKIKFNDLIRGEIEFDTTELKDFVIAKSVKEPLYHLAVVIDDFESNVTHIIRGEDHISNTPRQILIQEAIGAPRPFYAHLPLILASDRSKLSKRKHGEAVSLDYYRKKGFLPQAIINYLALLGWNPGTDQEIFTLAELVKVFDLDKVQKGGAIFDEKKLEWVNRQHVNLLSPEEKIKLAANKFDTSEIFEIDKDKICWKDVSREETYRHLVKAKEFIEHDKDLMIYATEVGKGNVLWPVRYALSGKEKSPDPFTLIAILGKEESLKRIEKAIEILK